MLTSKSSEEKLLCLFPFRREKVISGLRDAWCLYMQKKNIAPVKNAVSALNMVEQVLSLMASVFVSGLSGESFNSSTGTDAALSGGMQ